MLALRQELAEHTALDARAFGAALAGDAGDLAAGMHASAAVHPSPWTEDEFHVRRAILVRFSADGDALLISARAIYANPAGPLKRILTTVDCVEIPTTHVAWLKSILQDRRLS